jgi:hypothetical protein
MKHRRDSNFYLYSSCRTKMQIIPKKVYGNSITESEEGKFQQLPGTEA